MIQGRGTIYIKLAHSDIYIYIYISRLYRTLVKFCIVVVVVVVVTAYPQFPGFVFSFDLGNVRQDLCHRVTPPGVLYESLSLEEWQLQILRILSVKSGNIQTKLTTGRITLGIFLI